MRVGVIRVKQFSTTTTADVSAALAALQALTTALLTMALLTMAPLNTLYSTLYRCLATATLPLLPCTAAYHALSQAQKAQLLLIDLRGNTGGADLKQIPTPQTDPKHI